MAVRTAASGELRGSKTRSMRGAAKQANGRARDLELRIWTLLSEGKTPSAIAREVGIARQSVHRIIRRVEAKYNQAIGATVERLKARQARTLWGHSEAQDSDGRNSNRSRFQSASSHSSRARSTD